MNWIDIGFLILVSGGGLFGYLTGFLNQVGRVAGLFAAVYGSVHMHLPVMRWLDGFMDQPFSGLLAYVLLFIGIYLGTLLLVTLTDQALRAVELKEEDRQLGAVLGMAKGVLISAMLLLGFAIYPGKTVSHDIKSSYTGQPLLALSRAVVVYVPNTVKRRIEDTLTSGEPPEEKSRAPSTDSTRDPTSPEHQESDRERERPNGQ